MYSSVVGQNRVINHLLTEYVIKLASRCNIDCDYCYWFRDGTVYKQPKLMSLEIIEKFTEKLVKKLNYYNNTIGQVPEVALVFHGGEPLLYKKDKFITVCEHLSTILAATGTKPYFAITTNAILVDQEWCDIFKRFDISASISIDGDKFTHDSSRVDMKGRGTFDRSVKGLRMLQKNNVATNILAVANPTISPKGILKSLVDDLASTQIDVLIPDATYEDKVVPIGDYYCELFDLWYDIYAKRGVRFRYFDSIIKLLLGGRSDCDVVGRNSQHSIVLMPDGSLEANDALRVIGDGCTASNINVLTHDLGDVINNDMWYEVYYRSHHLPVTCKKCYLVDRCGGGSIQSRWSNTKGFNNPSVYCRDYQQIFKHIENRITQDIEFG